MKATAERIGKSKKERILIDGKVYIKAAFIDSWNYVALVRYHGEYIKLLKSATKQGINNLVNNFSVKVDSFEIAEIERV